MAINARGLLAALTILALAPALANSPKIPRSEKLDARYVWFDGQQSREIWLNPALLAEFAPDDRSEGKIRQAWPSARALLRQGKLRLWQIDAAALVDKIATRLQAEGVMLSPVLHDGPSADSRKRALPGNVIVYLPVDWDETTTAAWFAKRDLAVLRRLPIGANVFLVASAPGLLSLTLANTLVQSGEVVAAYPDWWQEVVPR